MVKKHLLTLSTAVLIAATTIAQEVTTPATPTPPPAPTKMWKRTAGIGLDAGQLAIINPRVGAGENRINLGGAANFALNYKNGKHAWDNAAAAIFAVQKLGTGVVVGQLGNQVKKPFQKSTDELRLNSKYGYAVTKDGKWFVAADASLLTQTTPTYKNNYLSDVNKKGISDVVSQFFSPAITTFAVGIDYKPTPKLSFFYSPLSVRSVFVQNDSITSRAVNNTKLNAFGVETTKNSKHAFGSLFRAIYADKFLSDKLVINSNLGLFTAYNGGQGVKVDWANQIAWNIYKGLQLGLNVNVLYDKSILVQVTDKNGINGVKAGVDGKPILVNNKASVIQQLLLKYAKTF